MSSDLFKKFTLESVAQMASTSQKEQKKVREELMESYPQLPTDAWEDILPKKSDLMVVRCHDQVYMVTPATATPTVLFFRHHEGPWLPHLRFLHIYPQILPQHQVDVGGCRYVISGANVMCQGLTSPGGVIGENIDAGQPVAIYIEGKEHAVAIGLALMSSEEIQKKNKGPCVENIHHLGDGLWMNPVLSASAITKKPTT